MRYFVTGLEGRTHNAECISYSRGRAITQNIHQIHATQTRLDIGFYTQRAIGWHRVQEKYSLVYITRVHPKCVAACEHSSELEPDI